MRWSKKTENTVQDIDGEEYNIDEIVGALNYYQKKVDSLNKENEELKNKIYKLHYKPPTWFTKTHVLKDKNEEEYQR